MVNTKNRSDVEYHCPETCNKCGHANRLEIVESVGPMPTEYNTTCMYCGFEDYWVTGYFESMMSGHDACKKYKPMEL